jgi:hypothetical protein
LPVDRPVDHQQAGRRPVEVSLSAADPRFRARQLKAYAKQLDHDPAWMTRKHLGMTADGAIEWLEGRWTTLSGVATHCPSRTSTPKRISSSA